MDTASVLLQQLPAYPSASIDTSSNAPSLSRQYDLMAHLERLKEFLATAPTSWSSSDAIPISQQHPALNRFLLPSNEYVTCVNWAGVHYITGTDIVRALVFRFEAFGRPVRNMKKFEEGVFSDLRNLKPGQDACLEDPKSPFLDLLFKYQCIRTQKKQKVFFWFSVPHDRLFIDALERDLKREKIGLESTTAVVAEPALSFSYDPKRPLFEQINASTLSALTPDSCPNGPHPPRASLRGRAGSISLPDLKIGTMVPSRSSLDSPRSTRGDGSDVPTNPPVSNSQSPMSAANSPTDVTSSRGTSFFNMFSFLEGTPTYKQRRKKAKPRRGGCINSNNDDDRMRYSLEIHSARRSFDIAPRGLTSVAVGGRHSLDSLQGNPNFLNGSSPAAAHYGFPPHLNAQQLRVHNLPAAITVAPRPRQAAPMLARHPLTTPEYICPLYTCRQAFSYPEQLHQHMSHHTERSGGGPNGMDVDPEGQRQQLFVHTAAPNGTPTAHSVSAPRNVSGSPEIPTFSHVLTTPNGSPRYDYDYDDDCGYAPDWSQRQLHPTAKIEDQEQSVPNSVCEQPATMPHPIPPPISVAPQPIYPQQQQHAYAFDSTSVASVSSTSPSYPPPSPTYPVSAPADQLTFNIPDMPPNDADNDPVQNRRPRSTTPPNSQPVPPRATHRRRPSTATAVLTSFGGGPTTIGGGLASESTPAFNVVRSNSFTTVTLTAAQQLAPSSWRIHPRGYHPYAAPEHGLSTRPGTSYSTSSAPSSQGSSSPFAVHVNAPGNEYGHQLEGRGNYLQEHEVKYEPQEYHITHEADYIAPEACPHHVEYAYGVTGNSAVAGATSAAVVGEQVHQQEYVEDGSGGEYMSEDAHHQGYLSQELSPEVQFAHVAVPAYSEEDYEVAHAPAAPERAGAGPGSDVGYAAHVEDVYGATAEYQCVHDMSMSPEVAASYSSGHEQTYPMQTSSHPHHDPHQQQHFHHHPHHDAQMLPYYQQQQVA